MTSIRLWRPVVCALAAAALLVPQAAAAQDPTPVAPAPAPALAPGPAAATPDRPSYDVRLRSDADGSHWKGRQTVSFRNSARTPLRFVDVRLWGNGHADDGCGSPGKPSPVTVSAVRGGTPHPLTVRCTALRIDLPKPLPYKARTTVSFDVSIAVPDRVHRFGRDGAHNFLGNALPLLSVQDAKGRHLDPDVGFGESYYTLAGDFRVALDHPSALQVPATGTTVRRAGAPGRTVSTSAAHGVRDFAWAAGPFRTKTVTSPGGVRLNAYWTATTPAEGVAYTLKEGASAVDEFGERFGRYPYGEIDLVMSDALHGGMEFPGLVHLETGKISAVEHEIAHQWWYGIVGNDQFAEPWLDEGFATYATWLRWGGDDGYCEGGPSWPDDTSALTRSMGYYADGRSSQFQRVVYQEGACALSALESILGSQEMAAMLKKYVRDHWLGVSTTAGFKRAAQASTTKDLTPFWEKYRIH
ncbi:metallopeptidase [Streptomyces spiroverticillatus]|uniref:Metallopeptidase n=1 Tax=Streptomyces finlayi TaxID=67296 RepID=A0A919CEM4_9ACTN|nr:M1 family metallopeptidase [Streptomyces finlayi]GHA40532.1 metallopeptidase [Streptomyces spiroverticillatus]GHD15427.1 metallopeptidase [Streptomyces finlayi]